MVVQDMVQEVSTMAHQHHLILEVAVVVLEVHLEVVQMVALVALE